MPKVGQEVIQEKLHKKTLVFEYLQVIEERTRTHEKQLMNKLNYIKLSIWLCEVQSCFHVPREPINWKWT